MNKRLSDIYRSFRSMPLWVQVWVAGILMPVNALPFFMLDHPVGQAGAAAAVFVLATNLPLAWLYRGMNRVLAIPHLIAWTPLQLFLLMWLFTGDDADGPAMVTALALVLVNGISLLFDAVDTVRWLRGERETPGLALH